MATVAIVETGEGAELGLGEGEAHLPGAVCREQGMTGDLCCPRSLFPSLPGWGEKLLGGGNGTRKLLEGLEIC